MKRPREMHWILSCVRTPALYTRELVMHRLGLHDVNGVSLLAANHIIEPLGKRKGKTQMWFFGDEIEELARDRRRLERAVRLLPDRQATFKTEKES